MFEELSEDKIKKIIIVRNDRIGDLVCTIPSIKTLRENFPKAYIAALLSPQNGDLLRNTGLVDEIIIWNRNTDRKEKKDFSCKLKSGNFDLALVFCPYTESYLLAYKTRAPIRAGIVVENRILTRFFIPLWLNRVFLLEDQRFKIARNEKVIHEVEKGFSLLEELGIKNFNSEITLSLPGNIINESREYFNSHSIPGQKGIIGLPLCCRYPRAGWKVLDLKLLAEKIRLNFPEYLLFISFGSEEKEDGEYLEQIFSRTKGIAVRGMMPLQLWSAFMQNLSLAVSIDSGAVHLAASGKVPSLVLYPENIYELCRQEWSPWGVNYRQIIMKPLNLDTIEEILCAMRELLS